MALDFVYIFELLKSAIIEADSGSCLRENLDYFFD